MIELGGQQKWEKYPSTRKRIKWYGQVTRRDEEYVGK